MINVTACRLTNHVSDCFFFFLHFYRNSRNICSVHDFLSFTVTMLAITCTTDLHFSLRVEDCYWWCCCCVCVFPLTNSGDGIFFRFEIIHFLWSTSGFEIFTILASQVLALNRCFGLRWNAEGFKESILNINRWIFPQNVSVLIRNCSVRRLDLLSIVFYSRVNARKVVFLSNFWGSTYLSTPVKVHPEYFATSQALFSWIVFSLI